MLEKQKNYDIIYMLMPVSMAWVILSEVPGMNAFSIILTILDILICIILAATDPFSAGTVAGPWCNRRRRGDLLRQEQGAQHRRYPEEDHDSDGRHIHPSDGRPLPHGQDADNNTITHMDGYERETSDHFGIEVVFFCQKS